jgi:hypothetical protein
MWMLKGLASGLLLSAILFVFYFAYYIVGPGGLRPNMSIGLSAITGSTIYRPLFWLAFVLTLTSCCVYARLIQR